jgi:hypothetical protein
MANTFGFEKISRFARNDIGGIIAPGKICLVAEVLL